MPINIIPRRRGGYCNVVRKPQQKWDTFFRGGRGGVWGYSKVLGGILGYFGVFSDFSYPNPPRLRGLDPDILGYFAFFRFFGGKYPYGQSLRSRQIV